jgi:hypothetical protein
MNLIIKFIIKLKYSMITYQLVVLIFLGLPLYLLLLLKKYSISIRLTFISLLQLLSICWLPIIGIVINNKLLLSFSYPYIILLFCFIMVNIAIIILIWFFKAIHSKIINT